MKIARSLLPLTMLLLSGCVVGPDYKTPDAALPAKFTESAAKSVGNTTLDPWWEDFRDKRLTAFVAQGMNENLDVLAALERISEAQANVVLAGAGAWPQINANGAATAEGQDGTLLQRQAAGASSHTQSKNLNAGLGASWLLDLFGQYARARESANASLDAAYDNVNVARLAYLSNLATTYISARFFQEAIRACDRILKDNPDDVDARLVRANAYLSMANDGEGPPRPMHPQAMEDVREACRLQPQALHVLHTAAVIFDCAAKTNPAHESETVDCIVAALAGNWAYFVAFLGIIVLVVTIHDAVALAIGYSTAVVGGLGTRERKALTFEVGIRNAGLGLGLVFAFFGGLGGMAIVAGWSGIWDIIAGLIVAAMWARNGSMSRPYCTPEGQAVSHARQLRHRSRWCFTSSSSASVPSMTWRMR